jgi:excisionase family DNA binding protein
LEERLLDVEEVSAMLRLPERTISTLAKQKKLRGFKLQNKWRFRREDVEAYVRQAANTEGSYT